MLKNYLTTSQLLLLSFASMFPNYVFYSTFHLFRTELLSQKVTKSLQTIHAFHKPWIAVCDDFEVDLFRITDLMTNLARRKCISLPNKKDYGTNGKVIAPVNVQIFIKTTSTK